jgi:hypothetical protein
MMARRKKPVTADTIRIELMDLTKRVRLLELEEDRALGVDAALRKARAILEGSIPPEDADIYDLDGILYDRRVSV